jgi:hypothetical protein
MIVVERPCDKCGEPTRSNEPHVCKPKAAKKRVVTKKAVVTPKPKETVTTKSDSDRVKRWLLEAGIRCRRNAEYRQPYARTGS